MRTVNPETRRQRQRGLAQRNYPDRWKLQSPNDTPRPTNHLVRTVQDVREKYRVVKLYDKVGTHSYRVPLPDFPRIPDGEASLEWGKVQARDFVALMKQCRLQTQVPACYIAEKMGVAPEIVYRLERNANRGIKLDTALRYLYALGLEVEIVEYPEGAKGPS